MILHELGHYTYTRYYNGKNIAVMIGSSTCSSDPDSAYQFYEDSYGAKWYTGFFPIG